MNELDRHITEYKATFDCGSSTKRKVNPEYERMRGTIKRAQRRNAKMWDELDEAERKQKAAEIRYMKTEHRKLLRSDPFDANYKSLQYIRYADDFIISSKVDFDVHRVEKLVVDTLHEFGAPFTINESKTRYGSSAGRNWNLGVMLNKDNEITVGHKKKRQFQSMLYNYITDKRKGISWPREDVQTMQGLHSYYRMVEPETIDAIVKHTNEKMETDVLRLIKDDLR